MSGVLTDKFEMPVTSTGVSPEEFAPEYLTYQVAADLQSNVLGTMPRLYTDSVDELDPNYDVLRTLKVLMDLKGSEERQMDRNGAMFTEAEITARQARLSEFADRLVTSLTEGFSLAWQRVEA